MWFFVALLRMAFVSRPCHSKLQLSKRKRTERKLNWKTLSAPEELWDNTVGLLAFVSTKFFESSQCPLISNPLTNCKVLKTIQFKQNVLQRLYTCWFKMGNKKWYLRNLSHTSIQITDIKVYILNSLFELTYTLDATKVHSDQYKILKNFIS